MKQKEYQLRENFDCFVGREAELNFFRHKLELYMKEWEEFSLEENGAIRRTYVLDVYGIGGVGKTTLLKRMKHEIKNTPALVSVYVDTSGDSSYIDIIAQIRNELGNATQGAEGENFDEYFLLFDLLYKIFFESYKVKYPLPLRNILAEWAIEEIRDVAGEIFDNDTINELDFNILDTIKFTLCENLDLSILRDIAITMKIKTLRIFLRAILRGKDIFRNNQQQKMEVQLLENDFQQAFEQGKLNSEYGRQKFLVDVFIRAMASYFERRSVVFFIDNFRFNVANKEVYQNYNWLTSENGFVQSVPGFFVLGERDNLSHAFHNGNSKQVVYNPLELNGLDYKNIVHYYEKRCDLHNWEKLDDVEKYMLTAGLKTHNGDERVDFQKEEYLPIHMLLAADYYNDVRKQKKSTVTVDDLGKISQIDDLWDYFEINLSDIKRDALYILSCLDTWKEEWFQKVRERFDIYLLSSLHVLGSISSVEKIDYQNWQKLKLHDVVREHLYDSPNNLIKYDILEWLFLYFLHMQHIETGFNIDFACINNDGRGINDVNELYAYVHISKQYIKSLENIPGRFTQEDALSKFYMAFEKSLDFFDSLETVNEEFMELAEYIIANFDEFSLYDDKLADLKYRLLFLYTYSSKDLTSLLKTKELYEEACKKYEIISQEERSLDNYIFKISNINIIKNALSWDEGVVWDYEKAADYGSSVLRGQYELMKEAIPYLSFTEEEKKAYEGILEYIAPDNYCLDEKLKNMFYENVEIYKRSTYFEKYASKWDPQNYKDLFIPYSKTRGNLPWFYFRIKREKIRDKYFADGFDPVLFGKKTYDIRKAIYGDGEQTFRSKHNVSVYLAKQGKYQEALELSEEILKEIADFQIVKEEKTEQEIEQKINTLFYLELIPEQEIREAFREYRDFLGYLGLGIEVLQYNSSYRQRIAESYGANSEEFKANVKEAIKRGTAALVLRSITFSQAHHREILNSWSYLASYYYYLGEAGTGIKIMQYLLDLRNQGVEMPEEKAKEFEMMLRDMQDNVWEEDRRLSEQKI